ncbi:exonuclease domain-containing protein [Bacillus testis]|uniref:exonuclease domain-containing protein n=1 Tax=Bacillus testis TaxID=1622072 RepID=UPI00067F3235|nr:exonuclease domain-containing protein [Bacillus testis]
MDFIAIDFETANSNNHSACSLGMVFVDQNKIVDEKYYLIKPPALYFHPKNIAIHGITPEEVENEKTFAELWPQIKSYFTGTTIIAHNAYFDMSVLKACLEEYSIEQPDFPYLDSMQISSRALNGFKVGQSLKARSDFFGIQLTDHHNALSDARACAEIVIKSVGLKKRNSLASFCATYKTLPVKQFSQLKGHAKFPARKQQSVATRSFAPNIKISDLKPASGIVDESHPLFGKNIVFTGDLEKIDRKTAMQRAIDLGAQVKSGVSKKTNYLVVGLQDMKIVGPNGMSTKETKAIDLMHQGYPIELLTEKEFLQLINQ